MTASQQVLPSIQAAPLCGVMTAKRERTWWTWGADQGGGTRWSAAVLASLKSPGVSEQKQ